MSSNLLVFAILVFGIASTLSKRTFYLTFIYLCYTHFFTQKEAALSDPEIDKLKPVLPTTATTTTKVKPNVSFFKTLPPLINNK